MVPLVQYRVGLVGALVLGVALASPSARVEAGCGCDKPPPPPAAVRPAFASPGSSVTLFASGLRAGRRYVVTFGERHAVPATATVRRDLADGVAKPQLVVNVPDVPIGPTSITVARRGQRVLAIGDDDFTVLQPALRLEEQDAALLVRCYSAAVSADGTVYLPLDIGAIKERMLFSGVGESFPLLFSADDVVIYNAQGFVMQLLTGQRGLYEIRDVGSPDSFELTYDRHEFVTYQQEHVHDGALALDPSDPAWHVDGTPHVDHDRLVVAIDGEIEGRGRSSGGSTPRFDLSIVTVLADRDGEPEPRVVQWGRSCFPGSSKGTEHD
ncbi:MAG: hypothetical protein AB1689_04095 [Thermodesulfobacteriota bacterium]